ncbi:MAG: tRNA 2-thiouridine(34) synthase MnmA [Candidatus Subteraquimicrobiales bacterium]|nr:tRNA 2-thiouridine(34) synthase MnmA [Candidatus Subteraquimicrobiales bacterium]
MREKVAVALSGGIDSSVAAALLIEEGYEVLGVTMTLGSFIDDTEAKQVACILEIPLHTIDLTRMFQSKVIDYFCTEYLACRTPNPCITCNKLIKFGKLLNYALSLGARYFATGHYVKIFCDEERKRFLVSKAKDRVKDQSYMLWSLSQKQLEPLKMPLGFLKKEEVRVLAKKLNLPLKKEESQEICFVKEKNYAQFLKAHFKKSVLPGKIIDKESNVLGEHKGLSFYTIGQRKRLGVAHSTPLYVIDIIADKNVVVVGEEKELYKKSLVAHSVNCILNEHIPSVIGVEAQVRYNMQPSPATVTVLNDKVLVEFVHPQRAISPGQSVVFYQGDLLAGGGIIESSS